MTPKQQRFVQEYLIDLNATQAAIRAGYSEHTAEQIGYQLLQKTSVAEGIAKGQKRLADTAQFTAEDILRDLEKMRDLAVASGQMSAAIRAAELRGRHIGMFVDRSETILKDERMVVNAPMPEKSAEEWARRYGPPAH